MSLRQHAGYEDSSTDNAAQRLVDLAEHTAGGNTSAAPRGR
jgi:hypothetical protein